MNIVLKVLLNLNMVLLISCSANSISNTKGNENEKTLEEELERFFSIQGLKDMEKYDYLGSAFLPFDRFALIKIQEKASWKENFCTVFYDGYWAYENEKPKEENQAYFVSGNFLKNEKGEVMKNLTLPHVIFCHQKKVL